MDKSDLLMDHYPYWPKPEFFEMCAICGKPGANIFSAVHALRYGGKVHNACLETDVECERCHRMVKGNDTVVSYWNAFKLYCNKCNEETSPK